MAGIPLTLDTLHSPTQTPLLSPHLTVELQLTSTPNERPSALTLDGPNQQHSNATPTSAYGNISPALSSVGSLSPSFLPEMPQWKRDLIQRRKQNIHRGSPTAAPSSSPLSSPSITNMYGLKTSTSSSSMRSLAGNNTTNVDQVASDGLYSPTKDFNKLSSPSSLSAAAATATKVNKQHATTIPATIKSTSAAATTSITTSPNREKTAKLFGGQYTAIATSTTAPAPTLAATTATATATATATVNTKEEITKDTTMEEEYLEKSKKTKEYHTTTATATATATTTTTSNKTRTIKTREEEEEDTHHNNITSTTTIKQQHQHQMATRLTGSSSSYTSSSTTTTNSAALLSNSKRESSGEREPYASGSGSGAGAGGHQQQYYNITGANNGSANQSSSKCESERLVCAVNNSGSSLLATTATTSNVVKISQKLQENQFIKNEQQHKTKIIKFKTTTGASNISDLKSPTKTVTATSSSSLSSASATNNCAIKKKMVAMQEMKKSTQSTATHLHPINSTCSTNAAASNGNGRSSNRIGGVSSQNSNDLDSNEDLSYGPGIVSKLRCRYLSLALRESMEQQRLNKDLLRRSTSLNNLLDDDHDDNVEEEEEDEEEENADNIGEEEGGQQKHSDNLSQKKAGILKNSCTSAQEKRFSQGSNGVGVTFTETSFNKRSRHLKRGNDSLKRARSVEALLSEKSPWQGNIRTSTPTCVTIEDKIQNARERLHQGTDHMPPKRLTSIIDDTERPPPDLVKQTLKMFEASANRRPRCTSRSNSKGEVASKVETFKNIIKDQKPVVAYPKPLSPTKKLNTPPNLVKPLKPSTQASDLLQTPLGRKTMAVANSHVDTETLSGKSSTLSDHTPDIIPRQKLHSERELNKEKYTMGINKEKFMNSLMESPLSTTNVVDSSLKSTAKEKFLASVVDSPVTALSKELEKMKLTENSTPRKVDNFTNDNNIARSNSGSGSGGGGGGGGVDDAFLNDDQYKSEEIKEMNTNEFSSLKSENDKIKQQINNEIQSNPNATAGVAIVSTPAHEATVKAHTAHGSSDLSDGEDDDEYGISTTKRITRTALDNIAKAGTTQQFKFSSNTTHTSSSSSSSSIAGKQIGVIRPLLNTSTTATTTTSNTTQKVATETITNMETLKHHTSPSSLTSREIEKNRINDLKKSSSSGISSPASSSSPTASLDNVIKSSNATSTSLSASSAASGYSETDTVISATNSPLWAMRKRRQNPPAAPAENTSMVFNFSNRKEVPDYIESDGVIFRRKRELPKPNESGFVLLGDLSVETSTDMDYDDFSMCPPSPCDVEFVNANIVIDGKSSIRQKSKDTTFHVQFNDTLTSTFEYPSEASLIVEDSFTALSNDYPLVGESDLHQRFQNLVMESYAAASSDDPNAIMPTLHHVADEIIQLPTTNESSSPANTTPTKNILGNLPLDCPDLEKAIPLDMAETQTAYESNGAHQTLNHKHNINILSNNSKCSDNHLQESLKSLETRKSRKDLKLPLLERQQLNRPKPPVPVKHCQMMTTRKPLYSRASANPKQVESKATNIPIPRTDTTTTRKQQQLFVQQSKLLEDVPRTHDVNDNPVCEDNPSTLFRGKSTSATCEDPTIIKTDQRKIPRVLSNPQYACFLRQPELVWNKSVHSSVQRSHSNEFRKVSGSNCVSATILRSNSLRNLENTHSPSSPFSSHITSSSTRSATVTTSLYFTPDVNSSKVLSNSVDRKAKDPANAANSHITAEVDKMTTKSVSLNNLTIDNFDISNDFKKANTVEIPRVPSLSLNNLQQIADTNEESKGHSMKSVDQLSLIVSDLETTTTLSLPNLNQTIEAIVEMPEQVTFSLPNLTNTTDSNDENSTVSAAISNTKRSEYFPTILDNMALSLPNLKYSTANNESNTYSTEIMINVSNSLADLTDHSTNVTTLATSSLPNLNKNSCSMTSGLGNKGICRDIDEKFSESSEKNQENETKFTDIDDLSQSTGPFNQRTNHLLSKDELSIDSLDDIYEDALNHQLESGDNDIVNQNVNSGRILINPSEQIIESREAMNENVICKNSWAPSNTSNYVDYSTDLVINELPTNGISGLTVDFVDKVTYAGHEHINDENKNNSRQFKSFSRMSDLKCNQAEYQENKLEFDIEIANGNIESNKYFEDSQNANSFLINSDLKIRNDFENNEILPPTTNMNTSNEIEDKTFDIQTNSNINYEIDTVSTNTSTQVANCSDDHKLDILNRNMNSPENLKDDFEKYFFTKSNKTNSAKLYSGVSPTKSIHVKTTDKFAHLTNKASKDATKYTTLGSGRKLNRNISKSFTNALTLYESFSEKSNNSRVVERKCSSVQRTASLMENSNRPIKAVDANDQLGLETLSSGNTSSNIGGLEIENNFDGSVKGSAPLGFYTPVKAPIDRLFQLGVTRAPSMSTESTTNGVGVGNLLNGTVGGGSGSIVGMTSGLIGDNDIDGEQEPESLQYIKPADDDLNIAYSEGTQKTDLLY